MTENLEASKIYLNDVLHLLKLEEREAGRFTDYFSLEALGELEQQQLLKIRNDFRRYLAAGKISEELVKFLTLRERGVQLVQVLKAICTYWESRNRVFYENTSL